MAHTLGDLSAGLQQRLSERIARKLESVAAPPLREIELFLTERCTLQCDYCFVVDKTAARSMTWHVARAAVDMLMRESRHARDVQITFMGGEPLLEFPLMQRVAA